MSQAPQPLSEAFLVAAHTEKEQLASRLKECEERLQHFEALAAEAREEAASMGRLISDLDEILGTAPQLSIHDLHEELRGERLRDVALDVLRARVGSGEPIHYRAWFEAVLDAGYRIGGKDPLASFLTQASRIDRVEKVGRRSGLYRLRVAA